MPVLLALLLVCVLLYMWFDRRGSTLTRACMWRQERAAAQWRCVACGAVRAGGVSPRHCLRPRD